MRRCAPWLLAGLLVGPGSSAEALVIDNFRSGAFTRTGFDPNPVTQTGLPESNVIGGERRLIDTSLSGSLAITPATGGLTATGLLTPGFGDGFRLAMVSGFSMEATRQQPQTMDHSAGFASTVTSPLTAPIVSRSRSDPFGNSQALQRR